MKSPQVNATTIIAALGAAFAGDAGPSRTACIQFS
jgi:hypothetical protein